MRACVRTYVRTYVRACVHACVRAYVNYNEFFIMDENNTTRSFTVGKNRELNLVFLRFLKSKAKPFYINFQLTKTNIGSENIIGPNVVAS